MRAIIAAAAWCCLETIHFGYASNVNDDEPTSHHGLYHQYAPLDCSQAQERFRKSYQELLEIERPQNTQSTVWQSATLAPIYLL